MLIGILTVAVNLRPAAVSVGPVLAEVTDGLGMSHTVAGVLTSLPVVAFAGFGALSPWAATKVGVHRVTLIGLLGVVAGLAGRALVHSPALFLLLTMLALAGMAATNVLLPSLIKLHFPTRIGIMTAAYTTSLAIGLTAALMLTVPISEAFDSWRVGLGVWAVVAAVSALPWLSLIVHDKQVERKKSEISLGDVARTRLGWMMAVFFGLQSIQAYAVFGWFAQLWRDAGYSPATAGNLVGIVAAVSIPLSLWIPAAAARRADQRGILMAVLSCYPVGYIGLMLAPHDLAVLWALLIGVGACSFPLVLVMIGLRTRTPAGTAALSGFTQSVGYIIAAIGPFTVGVLYDATGGWTIPLWFLLALTVPQLFVGLQAARPRYVEDELREPA
ncbi:MFS transporter [Nocardioides alcanivorans]|uniref:MFS transporter n=1 Tax=Nocardioides alcanivorans TaxID=2897352 RepID=UPI001F2A11F3|nr:MFS transporter [Nocardioides alcanivorans]